MSESADDHREGLRLIHREPVLFAMELLWRWSFGLGLLALCFAAYASLRPAFFFVDRDALRAADPLTLSQVLMGMVASALPLLSRVLAQTAAIAGMLWAVCSTIGRGPVTRMLVRRIAEREQLAAAADAPRWMTYALLQLARVLMLLILLIGYLAGALLAQMIGAANLVAGAAVVVCSLLGAVVLWSYVNWVLSLAPIFVALGEVSPLDATVEAIAFIRRRRVELRVVAVSNGFLRTLAGVVITVLGACTVAARALPAWLTGMLLGLETLIYLIGSDWLLLGRLAAYALVAVRERQGGFGMASVPDRSGAAAR